MTVAFEENQLNNVELFNEFVLHVFDTLYGAFPVPRSLSPEEFVEKVELTDYPPQPFSTYVGPDLEWAFTEASRDSFWTEHPWGEIVTQVEVLLERPLSEEERSELLNRGHRPLSLDEQRANLEWKEEKFRIEAIRRSQEAQLEDAKQKRRIFIATLQFLVNENLIRFTDLSPPQAGEVLNPPDILIEQATKHLQFVLTSKGFTHLNRPFKDGKVMEEVTLYQAIKRTLKEKATDGVGAVGIQTLVAWLVA